eukprot:1668309-Rhodomonas_salina.1
MTPAELTELDNHFKLQLQGNSTTKLQVMRTTVIKDAFGVVNSKKYRNLDYASEADFKALREATFPKGVTDDGAVHNSMLSSFLFDTLITKIMKKGFAPDDIVHWYARPWLHPVMQLWFKILLKYEGASETIDSNFVAEYNDLTAMGMLKAEKKHIHIEEVDRRLVLQLEAAQKAFTTVKDLCEHLCICALTSIVKDLANSEIAEANAWRMADNHLVTYKATISASATQMTICT